MGEGAARRRTREQTESAKRHRHADPPTREDLQRENERLRREVEDLQRKVAEREQQIGEAEKQIADLERQLAARQKNSTNSSKPPSSDGRWWPAISFSTRWPRRAVPLY